MKRFLKAVLVVFGTSLVLLLIGELLASFTLEGNAAMFVPDPVLSIVRKPDQDAYTWANARWIPVHINSHGLRGEDVPSPRPAGERRVLCLGDSFTFGGGVETHEAWPQQLQALLGPPESSGVRVLNAGSNGWDTRWQRLYLEARGLPDLNPDVVVLGWNWNDLYVDPAADGIEEAAQHFLKAKGTWLSVFDGFPVVRESHLFRWTWCKSTRRARVPSDEQIKRILAHCKAGMDSVIVKPEEKVMDARRTRFGDGPVPREFWLQPDTPAWRLVRQELATMKRLCDERGADFVVAALPDPTWTGPGTFPAVDRLDALLDELAVPWIDVQPPFLGRGPDGEAAGRRHGLWLHYDPVHPSAEGHAVMTETIAGLLQRDGLVQP